MFGRKKTKPPDRPYEHSGSCSIVRADPGYQPDWNEAETGRWRRECRCGAEGWNTPDVDDRVRNDPYDPASARHFGAC
jgi:hypothetical protein